MIDLSPQIEAVHTSMPLGIRGTVQAVAGMALEASDLSLPLGSICRITSFGGRTSLAEVVGFREDRTILMPLTSVGGAARGDRIENIGSAGRIGCSMKLLGRVIDGLGHPMDGKGPAPVGELRTIDGAAPAPLDRQNIREALATGIRAIDALHTCGRGQRMGIFAGPGIGKSTLLGSIARHSNADVCVVALLGERGREVQEFLANHLGAQGIARSVVVVSTSDQPPSLRVRAAKVACTAAEYFRDRGKHVLLLMDSLTRLCHAQRQIALAAREPPATRGYPPSVFSLLPQILERAGKTASGSITGFYSVLVEGDDLHEPISDAVKGLTDGHLCLSRLLANQGHYPAIDVRESNSRVRNDVCDRQQLRAADRILSLICAFEQIKDLLNVGAYVEGMNLENDLAVKSRERIVNFLRQDASITCDFVESQMQLLDLCRWIEQIQGELSGLRPSEKSAA